MRAELGLDALDAVRSIEALDDGRHRVVVDDGGATVAYVVTLERIETAAPTPLDVQGRARPGLPVVPPRRPRRA